MRAVAAGCGADGCADVRHGWRGDHAAGLVRQAMQAGAISYLLKAASMGELAGATRAAVGRPTLSAEATQALVQAAAPSVHPQVA